MGRRIFRKFKSALSLSPFILAWFPVAWILLGVFRASILMFKFKNLSPLFGNADGISAAVPIVTHKQYQRANQVSKLVKVTSRNTPWDSNCFPQAIVARLFLGFYHIPYALYFGLRRDAKTADLKAHAWVVSGPCNVSGEYSFGTYTVVAYYGSQSWDRKGN